MTHADGHSPQAAADEIRRATQPLAHHGNTPAAWVGSGIALVGFVVAAIGFLAGLSWPLIFTGLGVVLLSAVVGLIMRNLGFGARES